MTARRLTFDARFEIPDSAPTRVGAWWTQHRDAARNWLALGLLLAAWNATDDATASRARRPDVLRGYASVSVRAAQRVGAPEL